MDDRRAGRVPIGLAAALLLAGGLRAAEPTPATTPTPTPPGRGVAFEFNPLTALHASLRAQAESTDSAKGSAEPMATAIDAYRAFAAGAPTGAAGALYLQGADVLVASAVDLEDLRSRLELAAGIPGSRLPVEPMRTLLLPALEKAWPSYSGGQAARDEQEVRARMEWWAATIAPRLQPALTWLGEVVGITAPAAAVPVRLVPTMPGKGAATFRTRQGALIVAGTSRYQGSAFVEVILHEMLHAWEVVAPDSLGSLVRQRLETAGAEVETQRQIPHTLIFLLAAEGTKRFIDPEHVPVGEQYGAYCRGLERYRAPIEPLLREHLEGQLDRGAFIDRLVALFAPAAPAAPATP